MFNVESGGHYNCPDLEFKYLIGLIKTDRLCRTYYFTYFTFSLNIIGAMFLVDYRSVRYCLGKWYINSRPHSHSLFKLVRNFLLGTFCGTHTAAGTDFFVETLRFLPDLYLEIAYKAFNT